MKYYLISGEASGDMHASRLMRSLKTFDTEASFRFFGGDLMAKEAGHAPVRHYRDMAYMGFVPVLLHLRTIFRNMDLCKQDIASWRPDVVILVDYPGFNLKIARYVHQRLSIPVYYYISPKIWAWKEWRINSIRRDVDELFSILPFEVGFFENKHHYPIHYVGNPTADEVHRFRAEYKETKAEFCRRWHIDDTKPIIALLPGSRTQEVESNVRAMYEAARELMAPQNGGYSIVVAGAPSFSSDYLEGIRRIGNLTVVIDDTYALLSHADAAVVTSGTATLEAALFHVPQVVCYATPAPRLMGLLRRLVLKVKYVSLVNLIAGREVVPELVAETFSVENISRELCSILPGQPARERMLSGYNDIERILGNESAPDNAARIMYGLLRDKGK